MAHSSDSTPPDVLSDPSARPSVLPLLRCSNPAILDILDAPRRGLPTGVRPYSADELDFLFADSGARMHTFAEPDFFGTASSKESAEDDDEAEVAVEEGAWAVVKFEKKGEVRDEGGDTVMAVDVGPPVRGSRPSETGLPATSTFSNTSTSSRTEIPPPDRPHPRPCRPRPPPPPPPRPAPSHAHSIGPNIDEQASRQAGAPQAARSSAFGPLGLQSESTDLVASTSQARAVASTGRTRALPGAQKLGPWFPLRGMPQGKTIDGIKVTQLPAPKTPNEIEEQRREWACRKDASDAEMAEAFERMEDRNCTELDYFHDWAPTFDVYKLLYPALPSWFLDDGEPKWRSDLDASLTDGTVDKISRYIYHWRTRLPMHEANDFMRELKKDRWLQLATKTYGCRASFDSMIDGTEQLVQEARTKGAKMVSLFHYVGFGAASDVTKNTRCRAFDHLVKGASSLFDLVLKVIRAYLQNHSSSSICLLQTFAAALPSTEFPISSRLFSFAEAVFAIGLRATPSHGSVNRSSCGSFSFHTWLAAYIGRCGAEEASIDDIPPTPASARLIALDKALKKDCRTVGALRLALFNLLRGEAGSRTQELESESDDEDEAEGGEDASKAALRKLDLARNAEERKKFGLGTTSRLLGTNKPNVVVARSGPSSHKGSSKVYMRRDGNKCSDCGTRESNAWRVGPNKEVLCNGCGLRFSRSLVADGVEDDPDIDLETLNEFLGSRRTSTGPLPTRRSTAVERLHKSDYGWGSVRKWIKDGKPRMKDKDSSYERALQKRK
ncbi:hypothetical protein JCM10212_003524 [Sporobolomyces blumeae]